MNSSPQVLMFRLLIQFTKGNPTLARRPVLVSALRESKKIVQVQHCTCIPSVSDGNNVIVVSTLVVVGRLHFSET